MVAVARCNGTILVDDDGKLGIVERGGGVKDLEGALRSRGIDRR